MLPQIDLGYRARYTNGKAPYVFHEISSVHTGIIKTIKGVWGSPAACHSLPITSYRYGTASLLWHTAIRWIHLYISHFDPCILVV